MKWLNPNDTTRNTQDRRGSSGGRGLAFGGIGTIIAVIIALLLGQNPLSFLGMADQVAPTEQTDVATTKEELAKTPAALHANRTFNSANDIWTQVFTNQLNRQYQEPTFVLFDGATSTACGQGSSASGPFYCPADGGVYIYLAFFN